MNNRTILSLTLVLFIFSFQTGICQLKKSENKYVVHDLSELLSATKQAVSGDIIYIADTCKIFLPAKTKIVLNSGTTLKSGRNLKNSTGALLYTTVMELTNVIVTNGDHVVISSLRLQGPDTIMRTESYHPPVANGILSTHKNLEIENCEISGWGYAGIVLKNGATARIHDNYIHHNKRIGLGYGIVLDMSKAKIYNNLFEDNRLAISGSGKEGTGYEAYGNVVQGSYYGGFDMHGNNVKEMTEKLHKDFVNDSTTAGDTVNIHDNIFYINTSKTLQITGTPKALIIKNNKFSARNIDEVIFKRYWGKSFVPIIEGNTFGVKK